jgi:anti-anti-sigma factor
MAPRQVFEVKAVGDTNVVTLTQGVLDTEAARTFEEILSRLVAELGRPNLLLDLGSVESLTAAGLGRLVALNQATRARGGRLTLADVAPLLHEILEITHLTGVFDIRKAAGKGVLVVEEDATREALKTTLQRQGYSVACAADGGEALDLLRGDGPAKRILLGLDRRARAG